MSDGWDDDAGGQPDRDASAADFADSTVEGLNSSKHAGGAAIATKLAADLRAEESLANTTDVTAFLADRAEKPEDEEANDNDGSAPAPLHDMSIYEEKYQAQLEENITAERNPDAPYFDYQARKYQWTFQGDELPQGGKYEWTGEQGIIGPRDEELEMELFHHDFIQRAGENLKAYSTATFEVLVMAHEKLVPILQFKDAGLHPSMMENLELCGYKIPMPIQSYVIPAILLGNDVVACAHTGSGKTAAYLVPIFSRLMGKAGQLSALQKAKKMRGMEGGEAPLVTREPAKPLVLIMVPTRELAVQIFTEARRFAYRTMLRPVCIYGGAQTRGQIEDLRGGCDVLIATPGRLLDFIHRGEIVDLSNLKFTVFDEADELLDEDWEEVIDQIIAGPMTSQDADHTFCMFSATFPAKARKAARKLIDNESGIYVHIGRPGSTHGNIRQDVISLDRNSKPEACYDLLMSLPPARTIIFVNFISTAERLDDYLFHRHIPCTFIHSGRSQFEREEATRKFIIGAAPILIATGVMARGIDVRNVLHVLNYDLPSVDHGGITEYIHRIGRTGRIGHQGRATSFYTENDEPLAPGLTKILIEAKQDIPEFLEDYKPEDLENIDFEDESEPDDDDEVDGIGGSPIARSDVGSEKAETNGVTFGGGFQPIEEPESKGFQPADDGGNW